jgi:DNA-binding YbaB/EbfC family protein
VTASAGNDQVKVVANGGRELVSIEISPELLKGEDLSMVQDLIVAASNAALQKAQEMVDAELEKITGGMKIPGLT